VFIVHTLFTEQCDLVLATVGMAGTKLYCLVTEAHNSNNGYVVRHALFVNFVNIKQVLLC